MHCAFDEVVHPDTLPVFSNECLAWTLTTHKETFKLESDMLITSNIDSGGKGVDYGTFVLLQVYVIIRVTLQMIHSTGGCGLKIIYLNAYNGLMYFRHCTETKEFFLRCL